MASFQLALQRYQLTVLHFSEVYKYFFFFFLMQNKVFLGLKFFFYFLL